MDVRSRKVIWGTKWFADYVPTREVKIPDLIPTPKPVIVQKPIPEAVVDAVNDADKPWYQSKTTWSMFFTGGGASLLQVFSDPSAQKMIIGAIILFAAWNIYERNRKARLSRKAKVQIK